MVFGIAVLVWIGFVALCDAVPTGLWKRATPLTSLSQVADSYDYVIVGGGTSGLTVADRLTEDGTKTVLVVEYGTIIDNDANLTMPSKGNPFPTQYMYNITSVPQANLSARTGSVPAANIVGGGSAINAMFFDRGAKADYDAWVELGNPGWGWRDLLPYFKKAVSFTPPSVQEQSEYGISYDVSAYGGNGPVQLSYPPFQWPGVQIEWDAFSDMNLTAQKEGANGNAVGRFWVPSSLDPKNETRSDARLGHYERVKSRSNYHLLTLHQAVKINFTKLTATGVAIQSRDGAKSKISVTARKEVILAAGAIHTPQLLQLSGIGPSSVLSAAGVSTVLNLEGVGQNFQDHPFFFMQYNFTTNVYPYPELLSENEAFATQAYMQYWTNRTGPYSVGVGNTAAFVPLRNLTAGYQTIASTLSAQNVATYADPTTPATVLTGYAAQKAILVNRFQNTNSAVMEFPFSASNGPVFAFLKPTSRGTVKISTTDATVEPSVDFRTLSNPVDLQVMIKIIGYVRQYFSTPTMAQLGPVELLPGSSVSSDEAITAMFRDLLVQPSFFHPCCTASMMPRAKGGVVGTNLLVYGVQKLSVVDASIMPLIPGTHLCETVYAVAEKAADIIKARS